MSAQQYREEPGNEEDGQNNNREWFQANKSRYDSLRKGFIDEVQQLIDRIALFDPEIAGLEAKDCLFRIYRDIRFSPDKTPYKIHFAAYMASCGGRGSERAGPLSATFGMAACFREVFGVRRLPC